MTQTLNKLMNDKHFTAEIVKVDPSERMVWGYASTGARDSQGEIITVDALTKALPDYMKFANVREMHKAWAVGKTKSAQMDDKGLYISVKVVDKDAWDKVKEGVYSAFSIGGKVAMRDETDDTIITGINLNEISLVDRPANPEAVFDIVKYHFDDLASDIKKAIAEFEESLEDITPEEKIKIAKKQPDPEDGEPEEMKGEPVEQPTQPAAEVTEVIADVSTVSTPASTDGVGGTQVGSAKTDDQQDFELLKLATVDYIFKHYKIDAEKLKDQTNSPELVDAILSMFDLIAKAKLRGAHKDSIQAIHDHASNMGADCNDSDDDDKVAVTIVKPGELAKALDEIKNLKDEIVTLNKSIEELKALPVAKQPRLKVVSKGQDFDVITDQDEIDQEEFDKMTDMQKSHLLMKRAFATPLRALK